MLMSSNPARLFAATLLCIPMAGVANDEPTPGYYSLFNDGKASFDLRYRFELVDPDTASRDARASTLRSRLTFTSGDYRGFSFVTEFDDVTTIGGDDYNSTANGNTDYAVVADPEGTEVNQAYLTYKTNELTGSVGRQRILHGSQRFVGGVGWRQNEQTYDGLRAKAAFDSGLTLDYAYVYNVNRIFGPEDGPVQPGDHEGDSHFLRIDYAVTDGHSLSAFGYFLDIDENGDYAAGVTVGNSSDTYGLEYQGKYGPAVLKATYARQSDAGGSALSYDANYFLIEAAYSIAGVKLSAGYEELGADNGVSFKTPYATLHKFQGWADQFLATPPDGIEDAYLGIAGAIGVVKLGAYYHDFAAESSSASFGSEIDLVATWPVTKNLNLQLKAASFSADDEDRYSDTDKLWVTVQFKI